MAKRDTPDDLTEPVRLVRVRHWLVLLLAATLLGGGVWWGFAGRIPISLEAPGVVLPAEGSFRVLSQNAGQVRSVKASPGRELRAGDVIATLIVDGRPVQVRTAVGGRMASAQAQVGQFVLPGDSLAVIDRVSGSGGDASVAVLWVPAERHAVILAGMRVTVAVNSAPASVYGRMTGRVARVGDAPEGRKQIVDFVGDDVVADSLVAGGSARRVVVELERDTSAPSGFKWSRGAGPPTPLRSRTGVLATIRQSTARPVDWVLP